MSQDGFFVIVVIVIVVVVIVVVVIVVVVIVVVVIAVFVFVFVKGYEPKGIATLDYWNFLQSCLFVFICHCHPWRSVDSVCHQLSVNILFDRLTLSMTVVH